MKDEEMAEEYVKKEGFRVDVFGGLDNITSSEANEEIKQGFLAGLKAGRPQWHDLEKDTNDLPKDKHNVWCQSYSGEYEVGWYDKDTGYWTLIYNHYATKHIKAWCELPTFDKE